MSKNDALKIYVIVFTILGIVRAGRIPEKFKNISSHILGNILFMDVGCDDDGIGK